MIDARGPVPHHPLVTARVQVNAHIDADVTVGNQVTRCVPAYLSRQQVLLLVAVPEFREPCLRPTRPDSIAAGCLPGPAGRAVPASGRPAGLYGGHQVDTDRVFDDVHCFRLAPLLSLHGLDALSRQPSVWLWISCG
jgi:hypothetical protein